jgi:imidazolonepropionase-like amidohydrolase
VPPGAIIIDGTDRYLLPGFIDGNVHATVYGNSRRRETVVKYGHRNAALPEKALFSVGGDPKAVFDAAPDS